jgi:hypothetical protein
MKKGRGLEKKKKKKPYMLALVNITAFQKEQASFLTVFFHWILLVSIRKAGTLAPEHNLAYMNEVLRAGIWGNKVMLTLVNITVFQKEQAGVTVFFFFFFWTRLLF